MEKRERNEGTQTRMGQGLCSPTVMEPALGRGHVLVKATLQSRRLAEGNC